jgi:D-sedoheptulose 7-phosphate isomerase
MDAKIAEMVAEAAAALGRVGPPQQHTIASMAGALVEALESGGRVYVCGNGGSAADAQHIAGELAGRFRRHRRALACLALTTDTSVLTAVGNDLGFQRVFARQVEALGRPGDVLWALSTSGASANVLAAARAARGRGMKVLAMTGSGGGKLAGLADLCFRAPAKRTDLVQQLHQLAYHIICELIDRHFADGE